MNHHTTAIAALACIGLCGVSGCSEDVTRTESSVPPVHVTVILHNEDGLAPGRPDYTVDRDYYLRNRALVKLLAETVIERGAAYNFQPDWNYLLAVAMFDTAGVTADTGGKNIVRWMHEDLGVEIDPHSHENGGYNYADVAYLIDSLGVRPTQTVGGFQYDPPDHPKGWDKHVEGLWGERFSGYFWRADLLWGAAAFDHTGDDASSGIWRPRDRYNFYEHDPDQRLVYVGAGLNNTEGVVLLLDDIAAGRASAGGFYTASIMVIQDFMDETGIGELGVFIDSMARHVEAGRLRWATLTEMVEIWKNDYALQPFRHDCKQD